MSGVNTSNKAQAKCKNRPSGHAKGNQQLHNGNDMGLQTHQKLLCLTTGSARLGCQAKDNTGATKTNETEYHITMNYLIN